MKVQTIVNRSARSIENSQWIVRRHQKVGAGWVCAQYECVNDLRLFVRSIENSQRIMRRHQEVGEGGRVKLEIRKNPQFYRVFN